MNKDKDKREHKVGPGTGYETDGTNYWVAPTLVTRWGEIQDRERALESTIAATVRAIAEMRQDVEAERRRWWDNVYQDLELDKTVSYKFTRIEGKVSPVVNKEQE